MKMGRKKKYVFNLNSQQDSLELMKKLFGKENDNKANPSFGERRTKGPREMDELPPSNS